MQQEPSSLNKLPISYQEVDEYFRSLGNVNPLELRKETFLRIEKITQRPLISYVTRTTNLPPGIPIPAHIDDSDLQGFSDLVHGVTGDSLDVIVISNGGSAEATERIVNLLRERFNHIRFILPANAYSAATLMALSGDEIVMGPVSTLGSIDPQVGGIPARAILRAFNELEQRLKIEGPLALTAYLPLIEKYDLHILEICKSAEELSKELARSWLSQWMLRREPTDPAIDSIINVFASYDVNKSHARSISRKQARDLGLKIKDVEEFDGLADLIRSLNSQYEIWWNVTAFYKNFEDARGTNWGRMIAQISQSPPPQMPQKPAQ